MLGYIHFIDKNNTETQVQQYSTKDDKMVKARQDQREKIYRRFLFYKEFYALAKPLLLSEGWTDYIYIQTALKALRDDYPNLVSVDDQGRPRFAFRCLKYANSNTGKILQINGGTGEFPRFIHAYKREFEFFLGSPGMEHPVILLLDSDTGSTGVISTVKEMKKESISNKIDLLYVIRNLYIVFTPLSEGSKQSVIEDMFDQTTLSIKLNGKSFDRSSDTDSSIGYGKGAFARKIVEERASSINFNGFRPLLDRISLAVNTYYAQRHRRC
jgi:hypothetical protein